MRWEDAMYDFFGHICRYGEREGISNNDLTDAISKQIDSDTADCFTDYLAE